MHNAQETVLEIDLKALQHNFKFLKSKLAGNTKFLAVVKAYAYGSGAIEIAKYLEQLHVDYFAVAYADEGVALRNAGIKTPILVLHPVPDNFTLIIERCLEPSIYSQRVLNEFIAVAEESKQSNYPVHIKFNTGLNRLGFAENDIEHIVKTLKTTEAIKVTSIFSHLAASEDANEKDFSLNQIASFSQISKKITQALPYQTMLHICNTSGLINYPQAHYNMVRSGIGLYGFGNNAKINKNLKPIATLKTSISQIHTLKAGDSLGYNRALITTEPIKTATLPIGHADGLNRHFGNGKGFVFIKGEKAPIIGNVCMDMIMVDITNISCKEGDEVIVFGPQHTAENLAKSIHSISYELITAVSQRVKRVFYR